MTAPPLQLIDVVKRFGSGPTEVRALTDVSVRVDAGELVVVMGPSACGKSTLLHLAGGLEPPSAGHVLVHGADLDGLSATQLAELRRRQVGFVFQRLNLVPSLTALENVMLPLELDGVGRRAAKAEAEAALSAVGLTPPWDRYPDDVSGGQQQRIAIARAIVGSRSLLLADEPTGALDSANADLVIDLLAELCVTHGTAVLLVTHEPRFASYANRVVFLRDGRVVDETKAVDTIDAAAPGVTLP